MDASRCAAAIGGNVYAMSPFQFDNEYLGRLEILVKVDKGRSFAQVAEPFVR